MDSNSTTAAIGLAQQHMASAMELAVKTLSGAAPKQQRLSRKAQVEMYLRMSPENHQQLRDAVGDTEYKHYEDAMRRFIAQGY